MASGQGKDVAFLFADEELSGMTGLKRGADFVEVMCGCTSHRYGDAVGRLRVFASGDLEINCECTPGCDEDKLTPAAFEKHSGRRLQGSGKTMCGSWSKETKFHFQRLCCLNTTTRYLKLLMGLIKVPMVGHVTVMNLSAAKNATKSVGFACVVKKNAAIIMIL
ncbi:unnamed protein product [Musa acuminata subsp. burmannicoides]